MAKKDKAVEIRPGTQEFATREHFAKEKAAYEKRTGETVNFELGHPLTSTPLEGDAQKSRTLKELKAEAKELGIELPKNAKKDEIAEAIERKLSEAAVSDDDDQEEDSAEGEGSN
jgi:hypothetical protein